MLVSQFVIQSVSKTTGEPVSQSVGQYELAASQSASTGCKPVGQSERASEPVTVLVSQSTGQQASQSFCQKVNP